SSSIKESCRSWLASENGSGLDTSITAEDAFAGKPAPTGFAPLRTVLGVDLHVLVGQVGGPDGFAAIAATQFDTDGDFFLLHHCRTLGFGVGCSAGATAGDAHFTEEHIDLAHVQVRYASTTDSREDAAPVRVGSEQCSLDQWRV